MFDKEKTPPKTCKTRLLRRTRAFFEYECFCFSEDKGLGVSEVYGVYLSCCDQFKDRALSSSKKKKELKASFLTVVINER